ncbi:MAG: DUF4827 domain-containing protein [Porphyromonadaceae bacterium]|jgi:hypothetical protein|nr:DUF4827 domain-containing protein [Porphyromonadaceae bacterium]
MKRTSNLFFILSLIILFVSCSNKESFSDLQKKEEKTIEQYIAMNNIKVVKTIPESWTANTYFLSPSGLYIHISEVGDPTISTTLISRAKVTIRTLEYELNAEKTVISDKMDDNSYPGGIRLTNGDPTSNTLIGQGIYEAVAIMKNKDSKASIVVPSTLNTKTYSNNLTPRGYDIVITAIE